MEAHVGSHTGRGGWDTAVMFSCMVMGTLLYPLSAFPAETAEQAAPPGRLVYDLHCARCHGPNGLGDGSRAGELTTAPGNFQMPAFRSKSDEQLLRSIEFGEVQSPMHAWKDRLTRQQIQEVLAYIRQLGRSKGE